MRRLLIAAALAGALVSTGTGAGAEPTCTPTPVIVCAESQTEPNPGAGVTVVDPASGTVVLVGTSGQTTPPLLTGCAGAFSGETTAGGCLIVVSDGSSSATIFVIQFGPEPSCTRIDVPSGEQSEC